MRYEKECSFTVKLPSRYDLLCLELIEPPWPLAKGPYYWYSETCDQKYDGVVHIDAIKSPSFPKTLASGDKKCEIIDRPTEEITKWQIGLLPYLPHLSSIIAKLIGLASFEICWI